MERPIYKLMQTRVKHRPSSKGQWGFVLSLFSDNKKVQCLQTRNTHRSLCKGGQEVSIVTRSYSLADL